MWKQQLVETETGTFELFKKGEGEPLCVTHLYSEFNEKGTYFADPFTSHFSVYLINLRNAGNSCRASADDELSMEQSTRDLEAIREALKINHWSFAGHSTGAMLGLVYAIHFPESLQKVLINAGAASHEYMRHPDSMYSKINPLNPRLLELLDIIKSTESSPDQRKAAGREWTEMSLYKPENYEDYFSKPSSGKVVASRLDFFSYQELPTFDLFEQLERVQIPAIISCGRHDKQCPLACSEHINEKLPNSKLVVFKESNHFPFLEEPEAFNNLVQHFKRMEQHA